MNYLTSKCPPNVTNYLCKYGLNNWKLELSDNKKYNNLIIVPVIQELENIRLLFESLTTNDSKYFECTAVIFVVNNIESSDKEVKEQNIETINFLRNVFTKNVTRDDLVCRIIDSKLNIGIVDASTKGMELPEKEGGVGLARKVGMDLALTVFDYNSPQKKILICLDADCTVEKNYITSIVESFNKQKLSAAHVQYEHKLPQPEKERFAIVCYELFLRYYVLGLKYAESLYAFPTVGSTMICDYESYIKIGGMNKKKAAEDFYFMEKLAKVVEIKKVDSTKVYPSSRGSWRVPFGTGQRVNRYLAGTHDEYVLYDPKSFKVLKQWLGIFNSERILSPDEYLSFAKSIHMALYEFLIQNSFKESWNKILRNSKSNEQTQRQKLLWFDGFRTLKLIHFLRDNGFPLVNMFDALDGMLKHFDRESFRIKKERIPSIEIQLNYLKLLRDLT